MAALQQPAATAAVAGLAPGLSEKEQKEKSLLDRLEKRGLLVAGCMRKFLVSYWAARQKMLDAVRAAELAKLARKGTKGKKSKAKAAAKDKGKAGDKRKATKTPVQEAWAAFLSDLDERINKQKRCGLEDMYRGVAKLTPHEQRELACVVVASNNKKVPPTDGQNINSLNIRQAVFAAAAAFDMPVEKALLSASAGLALVSQRGASEQQLKEFGFQEADLLRVGCSRPDVIALSLHCPERLKSAGVPAAELLAPAATGGLASAPQEPQQQLGGQQGADRLRQAGYSATDLVDAGVHSTWDLKQGGYTQEELEEAGITWQGLRDVGFGDSLQEPKFLAAAYRPLCHFNAHLLPPNVEGTLSGPWTAVTMGLSGVGQVSKGTRPPASRQSVSQLPASPISAQVQVHD